MERHTFTNRLINEKSPYLLQHAHNPVDWYPWSQEAFTKAKEEDKPIFLSIGYSACHWCHVMERESFETEEVAQVLNRSFVCIKVDREERPDIDSVYMAACQIMTGRGGWPLTIMMTPQQKPFYGATYLPPVGEHGLPGLMDLAEMIHGMWRDEREKLLDFSEDLLKRLSQGNHQEKELNGFADIISSCHDNLVHAFDKRNGGFGSSPKFPTPQNLLFLMRYYNQKKDASSLAMVVRTLERMLRGGIYDHVGGGFARYSTDERWLVPHFEKMLYDNALLAMCYAEAYSITQRPVFKLVSRQVLNYLTQVMSHETGGFYSAEDADSEGVEGKYYVWSPDEILQTLGEDLGSRFCKSHDISSQGNFEGASIPNLIANEHWEEDFIGFQAAKDCLKAVRDQRIHPPKDDKILTGWNGLAIAAFALCGRIFHAPDYVEQAVRTYGFVEGNLLDHEKKLYARYREGERKYAAYCDDYAAMLWASLELYESTMDYRYLKRAQDYAGELIRLFWDEEKGGFFTGAQDVNELLINPKEALDNAMPSGNSMAAYSLIRLGRLKGLDSYVSYGKKTFESFGQQLEQYPHAFGFMCAAMLFDSAKPVSAVLVGDPDAPDYQASKVKLESLYLPFVTKGFNVNPEDPGAAAQSVPGGETGLYICEDFMCRQPVRGLDAILDELDRLKEHR